MKKIKPKIEQAIEVIIDHKEDWITKSDLRRTLPFPSKAVENTIIRAREMGYLKSMSKLPGSMQRYEILKRDPYKSPIRFKKGLRFKTKTSKKKNVQKNEKLDIKIEVIRGERRFLFIGHVSDSAKEEKGLKETVNKIITEAIGYF